MQIVIQKNKQEVRFYVNEKEVRFSKLIALCKKEQVSMCHVITWEGQRKLVECYIPFHDEESFRQRLIKAAKAKA